MCHAERGRARHNAIEITWIALRCHQRLTAAIGTAVEVGVAPGFAIVLLRDLLRDLRDPLDRAVCIIDARLLVAGKRCVSLGHGRSTRMTCIGRDNGEATRECRSCIRTRSAPQRGTHRAIHAAPALKQKAPFPLDRQPHPKADCECFSGKANPLIDRAAHQAMVGDGAAATHRSRRGENGGSDLDIRDRHTVQRRAALCIRLCVHSHSQQRDEQETPRGRKSNEAGVGSVFHSRPALLCGKVFGKEGKHLCREAGGDAVAMVSLVGLELVCDSKTCQSLIGIVFVVRNGSFVPTSRAIAR